MATSAEPASHQPRDGMYPLSAVQWQLVAAHARDSSGSAYTIPAVLRVIGPLDARALADAFYDVTVRHEILRLGIGLAGGAVTGRIAQDGLRPLIVDLRGTDNPGNERDAVVADTVRTPWDLDGFGPLLRAAIVLESEGQATLAVGVHHAIADGLSLSVIFADLSTHYRARRRGHKPLTDVSPIQYTDVITSQMLADREMDKDAARFWAGHLSGMDPGLSLPTDFRRMGDRGPGGHRRLNLGPGLRERVDEFARQAGCSPFTVLLACYHVYLARITGQGRVIVGVPTAVRPPRLSAVVGPLLNVLPVCGPDIHDRSLAEIVTDTAGILRSCLRYQDVRPELFAQALEIRPGSSAAYQTTFTFVGEDRGRIPLDDLELVPVPADNGGAKFDFALSVAVVGASYELEAEFATDILAPSTADSLAAAYRSLVTNLLDAPHAPATLASMTDPDDAAIQIDDRRPTRLASRGSLADGFARSVAGTPDSTALVDGAVRLTYHELDEATTLFARGLQQRGVRPGDRVGLLLPRGRGQVLAIIGVLKAGASYVPIDVGNPTARVEAILADCRPRMLVVGTGDDTGQRDIPTVRVDGDGQIVGVATGPDPLPTRDPDDIAYVIYTSGSTGTPKGVAVQDWSVRRLVNEATEHLAFDGDDAWTMFHSYAFDVSVWEMWGALLTGGRVVTVTAEVARAPRSLLDLLAAERITILSQTPSAFRGLVREDASCHHTHTLAVRAVVLAGERLDVATLAPWFAGRHSAAHVVNMYGITETTIHTTFREITPADLVRPESSPIGRPLAGSSIHVLDDALNPVPPGVPGELYVGGPGVAVGYLTASGRTAERFVPDPSSGRAGARLYRSGDWARWRDDGELESLGRRDQQVKIRGFRVELGEIESVLESFPAVMAAVADVRSYVAPEATLVGYLRLAEDRTEPSVEALRAHCAAALPDYMVPALFVPIPDVPLTTNGKVNRRALPAPSADRLATVTPHEPPRTPTEDMIAGIWRHVLGVEAPSVHDNFFALGGDSMRALEVVARLRDSDLVADVQAIYRWQTIADLGNNLEPVEQSATDSAQPFSLVSAATTDRLSRSGYVDAYPLTAAQAGILYHRLALGSGIYHNSVSVRLTGTVAEEPFREAMRLVIRRHPILRTGIETGKDPEPLQVVAPDAEPRLTFVDLRGAPPDQVADRIAADLAAERGNEFDLSTPPLFRILVHQTGDEVFHLTMSDNHMILDGWSWTATMAEIFRYQAEIIAGRTPVVPPPPPPYADLVRREIEAARCDEDQSFWQNQVTGGTPAQVADLRPAGGPAVCRRVVGIGQELAGRLGAQARRHGLPLKSLVLGVHYWVLEQLSGADEVTSGVAFNGRPELVGAADMRGLFVNVLPLRGPAAERCTSWIDRARATHGLESRALGHRWFPASQVQAGYGAEPLFDTCFTYVHFHSFRSVTDAGLIGFDDGPHHPAATEDTHYALVVAFSVHPPDWALELVLAYDSTRVSDERVGQLAELYLYGLGRMADGPDPVSAIRGVPQRVAGSLHRASSSVATLLDDVREVVERWPDRIAVRSHGGKLTIRELDGWANAVAMRLMRLGVRSGDRVAAVVAPGRAALAAVLGVLKAGAVCVPVEPRTSADRLAGIVGMLGCSAIVRGDAVDSPHNPALSSLSIFSDRPEFQRAAGIRVRCEDTAYVAWTSGISGQAKPVLLTHGCIGSSLHALADALGHGAGDVHAVASPLDASMAHWEIWAPLFAGATLWLPPAQPAPDPQAFVGGLIAEGVTSICFSPTQFTAMLPALQEASDKLRLRWVVLTGEAVDAELLRRWFAHPLSARCDMYNGYGSAETAGPLTLYRFTAVDANRTRARIGACLAGAHVAVLDERMAPVLDGGVGELYVGGPRLSQGYVNSAADTADHFVPDPTSTEPGGRRYRTGDRARFTDATTLELVGRCGPPVVIGGKRIYLDQIESAARSHPDVLDCAAAVVAHRGLDRHLVLYVVPRSGTEPERNSIRNHLAARLATHAVPAAIVHVPALPTLSNGAVDRRALAAVEPDDEHLRVGAALQPRTPVEVIVREIWQEHLGVQDLDIESHFYELGGHSLLATRVLLAAQERFGVAIPVTDVVADFTIAGMARLIDARFEAAVAELDDEEVVRLLNELQERDSATDGPLAMKPTAAGRDRNIAQSASS